jgi:pimeloyl-ACP methyl ester carboxylesterase
MISQASQSRLTVNIQSNTLCNRPTFAIMQNCGHYPMIEEPAEFVQNVNRLIQ